MVGSKGVIKKEEFVIDGNWDNAITPLGVNRKRHLLHSCTALICYLYFTAEVLLQKKRVPLISGIHKNILLAEVMFPLNRQLMHILEFDVH
ncbi:hypothetical protein ACJX0J_019810, partial [Zea mays]